MVQRGIVIKTEGEDCSVVVFRESSCGGHCKSCGLCGDMRVQIKVKNTCHASEGDIVRIESSSKSILFAAFVVYMLPVIFFLAAWAVFYSLTDGQALLSSVGGVCGLIVAVVIGKAYNRLIKDKGGVNYEIFVDKESK